MAADILEFRRQRKLATATTKDPVKMVTYTGRVACKIDENDFFLFYDSCGNVIVTIDLRTGQVMYTHEEMADMATDSFWTMLALKSPLYVRNKNAEDNGLQVE